MPAKRRTRTRSKSKAKRRTVRRRKTSRQRSRTRVIHIYHPSRVFTPANIFGNNGNNSGRFKNVGAHQVALRDVCQGKGQQSCGFSPMCKWEPDDKVCRRA